MSGERHHPTERDIRPLTVLRVGLTGLFLAGSIFAGIRFFPGDSEVEAEPNIDAIAVQLVPDGAPDGQVTDAKVDEITFTPQGKDGSGGTSVEVDGYAITAESTVTLTVPKDAWGSEKACGRGMSCTSDQVPGSAWKYATMAFGGAAGEGDEYANPAQLSIPRVGEKGYVASLSRRSGYASVALPQLTVQVQGADAELSAMPRTMSTRFSVELPTGRPFVWTGSQLPVADDLNGGASGDATDSDVTWSEQLEWYAPFMAVEAREEQYQTDWSTPTLASGTNEGQLNLDEQGLFISGIAWGIAAAAALALIAELRTRERSASQ